jgi:hypothetical protein
MWKLAKALALVFTLSVAALAVAQEGNVLYQGNINLPRDIKFGDQTVARGSYQIALTEADGDSWFVLSKSGQEVSRDLAIVWPANELPTQGMQSEILAGGEYFRVRVRHGSSVYFIHYLIAK